LAIARLVNIVSAKPFDASLRGWRAALAGTAFLDEDDHPERGHGFQWGLANYSAKHGILPIFVIFNFDFD